MLRNYAQFLLSAACLFSSVTVFADVPFSEQELQVLRKHMHDNIAGKNKVFTKIDEGRTITSQPGAILASPSNKEFGFSQDYQFHWTRDAAITMRQVTREYQEALAQHQQVSQPIEVIHDYIAFESKAQQQLSNPGEQTLGQPKFNIDGTVWEGMWGRPQNDGAAIRALALCAIGRENMDLMREVVPLMKTDLNYVNKAWQQPNFDLWEEVKDNDHFFTKRMQHYAMVCGSYLLYFTEHPLSQFYSDTATEIQSSLDKHWNEKLGYITETIGQLNYKGGGLNSGVLLAVLYGDEFTNVRSLPAWSVRDDRVMSTVAALRDAFYKEYPINFTNPNEPPLMGRYPGDKYDGNLFQQGNPWIITTAALAEYYYTLARAYKILHLPIEITARNVHFFEQLGLKAAVGKRYEYGAPEYEQYVAALITEGDRILRRIKTFGTCGSDHDCLHFSEQIDAKTGQPTSAKDLTWSYVGILRAIQAREAIGGLRHKKRA